MARKKLSIINEENVNEVNKQINKEFSKNKEIIIQGKDINFNRKILENKKVSILILQHKQEKQFLKQRNSSLNQVLCKIAKKNNITMAFDFQEIMKTEGKQRALILSRIKQNLKLCEKYKINVKIINIPSKKQNELFSLLLCLGLNTKTAKQAVEEKP